MMGLVNRHAVSVRTDTGTTIHLFPTADDAGHFHALARQSNARAIGRFVVPTSMTMTKLRQMAIRQFIEHGPIHWQDHR
jgi:nitrogenase subunit NifH